MYYLKCDNCGHFNEMNSEYQVYCSKCKQKLGNNYTAWKYKHSDKSFEEYKNLVCISEIEIDKVSQKMAAKKPKGLKYWVVFTLSLLIASLIGTFGSHLVKKWINVEHTSKDILKQEWIMETYGDYGLTVTTPEKMKHKQLPISDQIREVILKMDTYSYENRKGFKVIINTIEYSPQVESTNLEGAANGSVNEMRLMEGVINFDYSQDELIIDNIPGFIQKGSFSQNGTKVSFINTGFAEGRVLWQVMALYQSQDIVGKEASERVIQSISFNP